MRWRYLLPIVAVLGVLTLLAYGFTRDPREIKSPLIGKRAPPFTLTLFDGGRFDLEAHRDKVVVVSFWASWCVPCREEAPLLEGAWRAYRGRGVLFVGVNVQDQEDAARRFIAEFGLTFPNGPDPGSRIAVDYGVYGIPELFFVDRTGRFTYKHIGAIGAALLRAKVEDAQRGVVSRDEGRSDRYQPAR
ncbi:MAG: TlpA family protein disulfide reductase [Candidatus Rokubacteria bacterium]|nr:TlpA family protein disulfide reductase [Candidatus Rokubacteria bacterium]